MDNLAAALQGAKLRKVQPQEKEAAATSAVPSAAQIDAYCNRVRECDLDAWYDQLKSFTFKTVFLPISPAEGRSIMKKEPAKLTELTQRIDAVIQQFGGMAFGKLSSRSPKDVTVEHPKTVELYQQFLQAYETQDGNNRLKAVNRAHITALKVSSGSGALKNFLKNCRFNY
jgi:hypothetical protein